MATFHPAPGEAPHQIQTWKSIWECGSPVR